jgi:hypothetical protein
MADYTLEADPGTYALTGALAVMSPYLLVAEPGSYALSGPAASLVQLPEKFDGLDGAQKFLVEEVGHRPGSARDRRGTRMYLRLREVD